MKKILIIEDNADVRDNTAEILELASYEVLTAENGKIGVEIAKKEIPDLIICDIMMPEVDGYGVLHMLGKNTITANIPFIFLTAKAEKSDFRKGMNMGADDYLTKPFDDLELLDAIEIRLKKFEAQKSEFTKNIEGLEKIIKESKTVENFNELLSDKKRVIHFKKNQTLYMEGQYPNSLYFIKSGNIKTFISNEYGRELITGLHKDGDFIGYIDLLENQPHTENAECMTECEICLIPKQEFYSIISASREITNKFLKILSKNLVEREQQLIKLAYNSVRKRVAEGLITVWKNQSGENKENVISIKREDLSSLVGASTETVIRTLSDFKDENLIRIEGKSIILVNPEKLSKMKN